MHTKPYLLLLSLLFFCFVLSFPPLSFGVVLAFQWPLFMLKTFPHTCKQGLRGTNSTFSIKEQGTGIVVKALSSNQCGPGSIPELDGICGLSLLMVPILAPRFFSGYSGFPLSSKTNIYKFQFNLDYCCAFYHKPLAKEIAHTWKDTF